MRLRTSSKSNDVAALAASTNNDAVASSSSPSSTSQDKMSRSELPDEGTSAPAMAHASQRLLRRFLRLVDPGLAGEVESKGLAFAGVGPSKTDARRDSMRRKRRSAVCTCTRQDDTDGVSDERSSDTLTPPIEEWATLFASPSSSSQSADHSTPYATDILVRSYSSPSKVPATKSSSSSSSSSQQQHLFSVQSTLVGVSALQFWTLMAHSGNRSLWDNTCEEGCTGRWISDELTEDGSCEGGNACCEATRIAAQQLAARVEILRMGGIFMVAKPRDMTLLSVDARLPPQDNSSEPQAGRLRLLSVSTSIDDPAFPPRKGYNRFQLAVGGFMVEELPPLSLEAEGIAEELIPRVKVTQVSDLGETAAWVPASIVKMVASTLVPRSLTTIAKVAAGMEIPAALADQKSPTQGKVLEKGVESRDTKNLNAKRGQEWFVARLLPGMIVPADAGPSSERRQALSEVRIASSTASEDMDDVGDTTILPDEDAKALPRAASVAGDEGDTSFAHHSLSLALLRQSRAPMSDDEEEGDDEGSCMDGPDSLSSSILGPEGSLPAFSPLTGTETVPGSPFSAARLMGDSWHSGAMTRSPSKQSSAAAAMASTSAGLLDPTRSPGAIKRTTTDTSEARERFKRALLDRNRSDGVGFDRERMQASLQAKSPKVKQVEDWNSQTERAVLGNRRDSDEDDDEMSQEPQENTEDNLTQLLSEAIEQEISNGGRGLPGTQRKKLTMDQATRMSMLMLAHSDLMALALAPGARQTLLSDDAELESDVHPPASTLLSERTTSIFDRALSPSPSSNGDISFDAKSSTSASSSACSHLWKGAATRSSSSTASSCLVTPSTATTLATAISTPMTRQADSSFSKASTGDPNSTAHAAKPVGPDVEVLRRMLRAQQPQASSKLETASSAVGEVPYALMVLGASLAWIKNTGAVSASPSPAASPLSSDIARFSPISSHSDNARASFASSFRIPQENSTARSTSRENYDLLKNSKLHPFPGTYNQKRISASPDEQQGHRDILPRSPPQDPKMLEVDTPKYLHEPQSQQQPQPYTWAWMSTFIA